MAAGLKGGIRGWSLCQSWRSHSYFRSLSWVKGLQVRYMSRTWHGGQLLMETVLPERVL